MLVNEYDDEGFHDDEKIEGGFNKLFGRLRFLLRSLLICTTVVSDDDDDQYVHDNNDNEQKSRTLVVISTLKVHS